VGDAVLIETSRRLLGVIRDGDTVARLGGDEFVLVVEPWNRAKREDGVERLAATDQHFSVEIAQRIVRALGEPFEVEGVQYTVSVSVGIALGRSDSQGAHDEAAAVELLNAADAAMYTAKKSGRNRVHAPFV
jgi:diguanylate cyclase (GGDEF)-like protein